MLRPDIPTSRTYSCVLASQLQTFIDSARCLTVPVTSAQATPTAAAAASLTGVATTGSGVFPEQQNFVMPLPKELRTHAWRIRAQHQSQYPGSLITLQSTERFSEEQLLNIIRTMHPTIRQQSAVMLRLTPQEIHGLLTGKVYGILNENYKANTSASGFSSSLQPSGRTLSCVPPSGRTLSCVPPSGRTISCVASYATSIDEPFSWGTDSHSASIYAPKDPVSKAEAQLKKKFHLYERECTALLGNILGKDRLSQEEQVAGMMNGQFEMEMCAMLPPKPSHTNSATVAFSSEMMVDPANDMRCFVNLNIHTDEETSNIPKRVFMHLDLSGSMRNIDNPKIGLTRLQQAKDAIIKFVNTLSDNDEFALSTFSSETKVIVPIIRMTKENKEMVTQTMRILQVDGDTNMFPGLLANWQLAANLAKDIKGHGRFLTNFVTLTDGEDSNLKMDSEIAESWATVLQRFGKDVKFTIVGIHFNNDGLKTFTDRMGGTFIPSASSNLAETLTGLKHTFSIPSMEVNPTSFIKIQGAKIVSPLFQTTTCPNISEDRQCINGFSVSLNPGAPTSIILHLEKDPHVKQPISMEIKLDTINITSGEETSHIHALSLMRVKKNVPEIIKHFAQFNYNFHVDSAEAHLKAGNYNGALLALENGIKGLVDTLNPGLVSSLDTMHDGIYQIQQLLTLNERLVLLAKESLEALKKEKEKALRVEGLTDEENAKIISGFDDLENLATNTCLKQGLVLIHERQAEIQEAIKQQTQSALKTLHDIRISGHVTSDMMTPIDETIGHAGRRLELYRGPSRFADRHLITLSKETSFKYTQNLAKRIIDCLLPIDGAFAEIGKIIYSYTERPLATRMMLRPSTVSNIVAFSAVINDFVVTRRFYPIPEGKFRPQDAIDQVFTYDEIMTQIAQSLGIALADIPFMIAD